MTQTAVAPGRRSRGRQTALDMVRSLAVIGAMVAVIYFLVPRPTSVTPAPVDVTGAVQVAAQDLGRPVKVPVVPEGWTPNVARFDLQGPTRTPTLFIGYLIDDATQYASIATTASPNPAWLKSATLQGAQLGEETVSVNGVPWQVWQSQDGTRLALVGNVSGLTTVVSGTLDRAGLTTLAQAATTALSAT